MLVPDVEEREKEGEEGEAGAVVSGERIWFDRL